ncbi:dethiobiotin synthase [Sphaerisporangium corydalis]|uniref:ATP-dependent dethiobiotin synthetase BioD n=1 Tax=Sphaerisporangium corydalis TaxID=1441875 RepID=A0ABV9EH51_9ACTN|nr:dethiobiotin synthase [Sphaerisporangium corydalis]
MSILVVTGTDTGVGTTVVTAAVAALARGREAPVAVVKPAQTGVTATDPGDLDEIIRLSGVTTTFECARFPGPLSPAAAARACGLPPVSMTAVAERVGALAETHRLVLVEGAGGLLVRYDEDGATIAGLARALGAPVLVVAGSGPGTLNHAALTLEALAGRGLELAGVVLGSWPARPGPAERSEVTGLETLAARPLAGALPEGAGALGRTAFAEVARCGLGPLLGGEFDPARFRTTLSL